MKTVYRRFRSGESGEIMLESSIIMVFVIILLMAMLSISFLFYQQAMMTTIASEVAADIAKNYKYSSTAMGDDEITLDSFENVQMCRMSLGRGKLEDAQRERAEGYVPWRVNLTSLGLNANEPQVECEIVHTGIGRACVNVTVTQEADFFLSGILEWLGIYDGTGFTGTASAECIDMISYTSLISFANLLGNDMKVFDNFGRAYVNIKEFIRVLAD